MALSKGKKILIAVVAGVVAIGTTIGVVLGIQNSKDPGPDIPSIDTPVDPNPDTPVDPTPDDPVDPTPDDPVDPDPDEPVDPDPGEEEPETPEMSEEDYRIQNVELLKEILAEEYKEFSLSKYGEYELTNISDLKINKTTGTIYFRADRENIKLSNPNSENRLFEGSFVDENGEPVTINCQTQEEFNNFLNQNHKMVFELGSPILNQISETTYDKFVDYVKEQSYDGVDFSAASDNDVFGITWFISDNDAYGYSYIEYKVIDNGKVYTLHAENFQPGGAGDGVIEIFMKYTNTVFKVVDVHPFEEFDINTEIEATAQAQSEFFLDLSEVAISKDQAQDLANAIRTSNPKKLGNMEVKLPAGNPDFEL